MAEDVDLLKIAGATNWYSGADLQSLLYTAQISTIEGLLENDRVCIITDVILLENKSDDSFHHHFLYQ